MDGYLEDYTVLPGDNIQGLLSSEMIAAELLILEPTSISNYENGILKFNEYSWGADYDLFKVDLTAGATYILTSTSFYDPLSIIIYDEAGTAIAFNSENNDPDDVLLSGNYYSQDRIDDWVAPYSGTFYMDAHWEPGVYNTYNFFSIYEDLDSISVTTNQTFTGTSGKDSLRGDTGDDMIYGLAGDDALYGEGGDDYLVGGAGIDTIDGGDGNDIIDGGDGNDVINGGDGFDEVVCNGDYNDYMVFFGQFEQYIVTDLNPTDGNEGRDNLFNVEFLNFNGDTFPIANTVTQLELIDNDFNYWDSMIGLSNGKTITASEAQIYRTYFGAMQRKPDDSGYDWWLNEFKDGREDLQSMATGFIWSSEFLGYMDAPDGDSIPNDTFLTHMYEGVFGRDADESGYSWWLDELVSGSRSQVDVLVDMTQSNEYVQLTAMGVVEYLLHA